jgi:hypothetical protein
MLFPILCFSAEVMIEMLSLEMTSDGIGDPMAKSDSRLQVSIAERCKHLRPFLKRDFWGKVRKKAKHVIKQEAFETSRSSLITQAWDNDDPPGVELLADTRNLWQTKS